MGAFEGRDDGSGRRIAGRYRLTGLVNAGGSGKVWAALDEVLGREVAIKDVGASPFLDGPDRGPVREHTLREARAAGRVDHPAVVNIYDVVEQDGQQWIVMQLVRAPSLAELIERDGPCTPRRAAQIGLQLLGALRAAHARGIVHRDVKPSNVLINGEQAVLTDFGIAAIDGEATFAFPDTLVGSPNYIAPELIRGGPATPASDLWALGATLYTAVEGRPPFHRDGAVAALTAAASCEPDPISRSGMLAPLLVELLRKEPSQRPDADHIERHLSRIAAFGGDPDGQAPPGDSIDDQTGAFRLRSGDGAPVD